MEEKSYPAKKNDLSFDFIRSDKSSKQKYNYLRPLRDKIIKNVLPKYPGFCIFKKV